MSNEFLAYDALPYTGEAYPQTHPDALFSAAWLLGMSPAEPENCRVLEIGCADGTNLVAMAAGLPGSTFVGVDGSGVQVAAGETLIAALSLENVRIITADLRDLGPELGTFDYVIAHGVYAWIAEDAREALLALCAAVLAPQGVAYISYNAYPGWHTCQIVRGLMRFHSARFATIPEQIQQARAVLEFMAESAIHDQHRDTLAAFVPYIARIDDDYLFHDYLEENNDPRMLWQFVAEASTVGLQYLGDSELHRMAGLNLPASVRAEIEGFTDDPMCQEQYLDFITDRTLRRTLLCRDGVALQRDLSLERAHRLSYTTGLIEQPGSEPPAFKHRRTTDMVVVTDPVHCAALRHLQAAAPRPVPFAELALVVSGSGLEGLLLQGVLQGVIQPHATTPPVTGQLADKPLAWSLARHQAQQRCGLTSRLHHALPLTSALEPLVVERLDGHHTREQIVAALLPMVAVDDGDPVAALEEAVGSVLSRMAREGVLVTQEG